MKLLLKKFYYWFLQILKKKNTKVHNDIFDDDCFENWWDFDEEGKFTLLYEMIAIPYGVVIADRLYHKWGLTNGQSTIVSSAPALGVFNTTMLLTTIYEDGWDTENGVRVFGSWGTAWSSNDAISATCDDNDVCTASITLKLEL